MDPATAAAAATTAAASMPATVPAVAPVLEPTVVQSAELWANLVLTWVGFGTIVGLLAKAIMPGRDPGGALATLLMGIAGTVIGCGVVSYFMPATPVTPISVVGFACGTGGAFVILLFYRLLGGYVYGQEGGVVVTAARRRRRKVEGLVEAHPDPGHFEP